MVISLTNNKLPQFLQAGLILMCIKVTLSSTSIFNYTDWMDNILTMLSVICMVVSIAQSRISVKQGILYAAIEIVCAFISIQVQNYMLMITMLTCFAIINKDFDAVTELIYKTILVLFIIHFVFFLLQLVAGSHRAYIISERNKRYTMGFSHPNTAAIRFFNLVTMWLWLHYGKVKWKNLFCIAALTAFVYFITRTRTMLFDMGVALVLYYIAQSKKKSVEGIMMWTARIIMPLFFVLMYICIINYRSGNVIVLWLDEVLSSRIRLGAYGYYRWGVSWFGQLIDLNDVQWDAFWRLNSSTFDSIYSFFLVNLGVIWAICIYAMFFVITGKRNTKYNLFIILWALYGLTEVHGLNGYMCFPILLLSQIFETPEWLKRKRANAIHSVGV